MCNTAKLRGKIRERQLTQKELSKIVGIDISTLNRKLKTGEDFSIGEANKIADALSLTKDEAIDIFFTNIVE